MLKSARSQMQVRICERLIRLIIPCSIYLDYRFNIRAESQLAGCSGGSEGKTSRSDSAFRFGPMLVWPVHDALTALA
jgi:hypothetical protein